MAESEGIRVEHGPSLGQERRRGPSTRSTNTVCTSCRQSKVRCIGSGKNDCSRCLRLGLDCHRDATYRRISRSRKIAELEKQVQHLTSVMNPPAPSLPPSRAVPPAVPLAEEHQGLFRVYDAAVDLNAGYERDVSHPQQPVDPPLPNPAATLPPVLSPFNDSVATNLPGTGIIRPPALLPRSIESVQLTAAQIDTLFQIFFEHYHPFLPFIEPLKSPDDYYKSSTSLFWAIIGVASRRYQEDLALLTVLSDWVMKLIWSEIAKPPYKLPTVQAIVLLCTWPFPVSTIWGDASITLSSIAVSAAMQVGLHRPVNAQDFLMKERDPSSNEVDSQFATKNWAAVNIVSHFTGTMSGQLPNSPFDWTIDKACEPGNIYTVPNELRFKLMIQRYCHRIAKTMCSIPYDPATSQSPSDSSSLAASWVDNLTIWEDEINGIERENGQLFSTTDQLYLAAARLYLHSFYFFDSSMTESRKEGVLKAYRSAIKLISLLTDADAKSERVLHLPYFLFRALLTATCIFLKVRKSSYAVDLTDVDAGKKVFNAAILAVSRSSVSNNDTAGIVVRLLARVWHSALSNAHSPPELLVKSRFDASITYDFVWSWRKELRGSSRGNPNPPRASETPQENSIPQFQGFFQDASTTNLDFLDDPSWNLNLGEYVLF